MFSMTSDIKFYFNDLIEKYSFTSELYVVPLHSFCLKEIFFVAIVNTFICKFSAFAPVFFQ